MSSPLPEPLPDGAVTSSARPKPRPEIINAIETKTLSGSGSRDTSSMTDQEKAMQLMEQVVIALERASDAAIERHNFEAFPDRYFEPQPPQRLKDTSTAVSTNGGLGRGLGSELDPKNIEEKAYQVGGVTFYGENSARQASAMINAPIREVWLDADVLGAPSPRIYNSSVVLSHKRDLNQINFNTKWVQEDIAGLGRADIATAGALAMEAAVSVEMAKDTLSKAQDMSTQLGAIRDAAIAEAEAALAAAEEALRLALEALEKAAQEAEEDEASEEDEE